MGFTGPVSPTISTSSSETPQSQAVVYLPSWMLGARKTEGWGSSYRLLEEEQGQGKAGGVGAPCGLCEVRVVQIALSTRVLSKCELGVTNKSYRKPLIGHL